MTIPSSPELSATVSTDSVVTKIEHNYVWTDGGGVTHATIRLGQATIYLDGTSQTARQLAAVCLAAADAMDAEIARVKAAAAAAGPDGAK